MGAVIIGLDVGQRVDPSALAVTEQEWRTVDGRREAYYLVRHLERLPLGTPYPAVAERLRAVVAGVRQRGAGSLTVYCDATGLGQPLVDMLKAVGVRVTPVYFTHGDRRVEQQDRSISLGKAFLVSRMQVLLQSGCILLPRTPEAEALAGELLDYEIRVAQDANERYGAFKTGAHDDLVTALGLAVQKQPQERNILVAEQDLDWPRVSKTYWRTRRG